MWASHVIAMSGRYRYEVDLVSILDVVVEFMWCRNRANKRNRYGLSGSHMGRGRVREYAQRGVGVGACRSWPERGRMGGRMLRCGGGGQVLQNAVHLKASGLKQVAHHVPVWGGKGGEGLL